MPEWVADREADASAVQALMRPDQAIPGPASPETIEELFEALESPLLSYALRLAGERSLAEDIVQEAFMRLHANFAEVREPRRWLYRTVHNLALNQRRAAGKIVPLSPALREDRFPEEPADPQPLPDEQIVRLEGIGLVRLSLQSLDERSREMLRLKFHENLSYKEISSRTGLTVGHVGYLLHHAIKNIASELAKNGILP
jgi:RNA polymerase sigma-70 factor (ECF subfamily)